MYHSWASFCDEFVLIRYLNVPNIMAAAISHRCTMLHPGYGFLAENATFVDICKDHGLNFIGPNVSSCTNDVELDFCFCTLNSAVSAYIAIFAVS